VVQLAPEPQAVVLRRIALMDEPGPEVVHDVATALRRRFAASGRPRTGLPGVVHLLHAMKPSAERTLLSHIAKADPNFHDAIRCTMFGPDVAAYCGCDAPIASDS
jgi:flagellar motor switch protein FliG